MLCSKNNKKMKNKSNSEKIFKILEKIASGFEKKSKEYIALEKSAWALHYIKQLKLDNEFKKFIKNMKKPLNNKQIKHLRSMGIDPDKYKT